MSLVFFKVYMTDFFFIFSIKSPQCADKCSKNVFNIAIFLSHVLMYQKHQISLPVRYKTARPKTGDWERLWRQFRTPSLAGQNFHFCTCPSHNALKRDAGGKKGKLLCCKRIFDWIKGNLAEIQPTNHQNVQKMHFLQKVPGVNGLSC